MKRIVPVPRARGVTFTALSRNRRKCNRCGKIVGAGMLYSHRRSHEPKRTIPGPVKPKNRVIAVEVELTQTSFSCRGLNCGERIDIDYNAYTQLLDGKKPMLQCWRCNTKHGVTKRLHRDSDQRSLALDRHHLHTLTSH